MDAVTMLAILISSLLAFCSLFLGVLMVVPCWDRTAIDYCGELSERFEQLGMGSARLKLLLRVWGCLICASLLGGYVLHALPLGIALGILLMVMPRQVLQWLITQRETKLRRQMVQATAALANSMRAGLSLKHALEAIAVDTPQPLKQNLQRIVFDAEHGRPLVEAIHEVRTRLNIDAFSLFAAAISVNLDRGGPLNQSLARISVSLQENERLQRKLAADTSAGRQMLIILSLFPAAFLAMFAWLEPQGVLALFQTLPGQLVLIVVGAIVCAGVQWGRKIMTIDL